MIHFSINCPGDDNEHWHCWCGEAHFYDANEISTALRNLGHLVIREAKIPELVNWLERKLK